MTRTDGMLHGTIGPRPHASQPPMRVLLVNDTEKPIGELRQALTRAGYTVLDDVASVGALLHAVQSQQPDVVVIDVDSPSRDTLEQLSMLHAHAPRPVVMFSGDGDDALIHAAVGAGVTAYVVDGLSPARLAPIVQVALARFAHESSMRKRLDDVQQALHDRKQIDRAKGLLMEKRGLSEADAYAALRQQAMKQGVKLAEVARRIVAMAELLG
ncbi:response regulator receiver and ANTAR domain protein [Xanthomonas vesicatoria ATCC 35937]|uniref:Response regulator receiver and ANTAR domain protein n=5 Tax=Xanthomonas TaxID=338 RepID=F0BBU0_9XANT|nr:response regulator receiver and ANTAR domain protein [Xanthomonas vesicatoria ATCC 35937]